MDLTGLCTFETAVEKMAAAEHEAGWLAACEEQSIYLLLTERMLAELARFLREINEGTAVEICAGAGRLTSALSSRGVEIRATDASPQHPTVLSLSAREAIERFRPTVVLGTFVPFDAGADEEVLKDGSVTHYVVLNARIGGQLGSPRLWTHPEWTCNELPSIERWMICRHDVWTGRGRQVKQHGEAWHFRRGGQPQGR